MYTLYYLEHRALKLLLLEKLDMHVFRKKHLQTILVIELPSKRLKFQSVVISVG